jgi:hypothetical protein
MKPRGHATGSINWTALTALAATVAALAALATAAAVYRQVRSEGQRAQMRAGLESLWHFAAEWDDAGMVDARSQAAAALLAGRPAREVDSVLDFFDEIALLVNRGVLDEELVWYEFYWPMANYWLASQEYVDRTRAADPGAWAELGQVMPRLTTTEAGRRKRSSGTVEPTRAQVRDFLESEVGQSECEPEDDEAQMTPL